MRVCLCVYVEQTVAVPGKDIAEVSRGLRWRGLDRASAGLL